MRHGFGLSKHLKKDCPGQNDLVVSLFMRILLYLLGFKLKYKR